MSIFAAIAGSMLVLGAPPKLVPGTVITKSTQFSGGVMSLASKDLENPALTIRGNNITIDFKGLELRGTPLTTDPDKRVGLGIKVEGSNITLKNLHVRGYQVGLIGRNSKGLKILDSDFSYNWKPHLKSTLEREDGSDWMSYHHNEKDEWLRYGGGIYLRKCDNFEVRGTKITGGSCGLMLMECNKGLAWNNDFSFLSAVGVGLYLSSDNRIMHNKIDWCVRGYSHKVYNRGQDSTGVLIYEQSNRNIFAYNSGTHGGDGFFLWAGQYTMDTGKGGCNDNVLYENDWSHSPANGIEATFSRNVFARNLMLECWHGIWGGYSYETVMTGNYFGWNGQSIAIEHGQDNRITDSRFVADNESIALWMNDQTDPNFAYAKARDCSSRNYVIARNEFVGVSRNVFNLTKTKNILLKDNVTGNNQHLFLLGQRLEDFKATGNQFGGAKENVESSFAQWQNNKWLEEGTGQKFELPKPMVDGSGNELADLPAKEYVGRFETMFKAFQDMKPSTETLQHKVAPLKGGMNAFLPKGTMRGRRYILVDEWGPYDFRSPKIWPRGRALDKNGQTVEKFEVLGPVGKWKLVSVSPNVTLSAKSGTTNQMLEARLQGGKSTNVRIVLEYTGKETVDYRGVVTPAGKPVKFQFERFVAPIDWTVNFYQWEKEKSDPRTQPEEFAKVLEGTPIHTMKTQQLDVAWYGEPFPGGPKDYFATVSNGSFEIDPGSYVLSVTADDGVRVKLDGKLIIDEWHYSGPTTYERTVKLGGKHTIEINQFEIDGYSTIKCDLRPAR